VEAVSDRVMDNLVFPPHPSMECGYTDPRGRRWIHRPWIGWEERPAMIVFAPRHRRVVDRLRRWWR
jgi:hypothetical protein